MEDGMIAAESMVFPSDMNTEVGSHQRVEEDHGEANKEKGGGGFISQLISSIVPKEEDEKMDAVEKLDEVDEVKEVEKGGGSIIDSLISKLVKPENASSGSHENGNGDENEASVSVKGEGVGNEGAFSQLISNFLHPKEDEGKGNVEVDSTEAKDADLVESSVQVKPNAEGSDSGEGGGILEHIVSHLPQSFPDDAAPTTDEATILIHSLVRD